MHKTISIRIKETQIGKSWSAQLLSPVRLFVTLWTLAHQAHLSMGFPREEYWCGLSFPPPWDLPYPILNPHLLHCQMDSLPLNHVGNAQSRRLILNLYWFFSFSFDYFPWILKTSILSDNGLKNLSSWDNLKWDSEGLKPLTLQTGKKKKKERERRNFRLINCVWI